MSQRILLPGIKRWILQELGLTLKATEVKIIIFLKLRRMILPIFSRFIDQLEIPNAMLQSRLKREALHALHTCYRLVCFQFLQFVNHFVFLRNVLVLNCFVRALKWREMHFRLRPVRLIVLVKLVHRHLLPIHCLTRENTLRSLMQF